MSHIKTTSSLRFFLVSTIGILLFLAPLHITTPKTFSKKNLSIQEERSLLITIETNLVFAQEKTKKDIGDYMQCNITRGSGWVGCLALTVYYIVYMPISFFTAVAGNFFDIVLLFSISPELIDQEFVKTVWSNVRDLANMAFIFILLWIAIATILRIKNNTAKDLLTKLVL